MPSAFGSLNAAIQMLYADTHSAVRQQVQQQIERVGVHVLTHDDFLVVNEKFTILVHLCAYCARNLQYWFFQPDQRPVVDMTLGVAVSLPGTRSWAISFSRA